MARLEAIYDLEQPRAAWLEQLLSVTYHAFRGAIGISAVLYRMGGAAIHVDAVAGIDVDGEFAASQPRGARGSRDAARTAMGIPLRGLR